MKSEGKVTICLSVMREFLQEFAAREALMKRLIAYLGICIYVKTLTGKTLEIPCHSNSSTLDIKQKFFEIDGVPIDQQCLIFAGKQLEDHKNIANYKIVNESVLYMVMRLSGGARIKQTAHMSTGSLLGRFGKLFTYRARD